ncbi:MAG TPA: DUF3095 family protein [Patescibacteria group bacterium]|nr:DUF3095 family protein [Patescibacteria group bacterium]
MRLPTIDDFARQGNDPNHYRSLDGDWWLAVADVVASTKLAGQGRDRDVNFVAGAAVAVLSSVTSLPPDPSACQFGGDGAIAAVPPACRAQAEAALAALAHWAQDEVDVPLRVGMVPVSALREAGFEVMAALHDFGNGNVFGLFLGSGISAADAWVKADARWHIAPQPGALPGLEGLSCRWRPVPAHRGVVLCVIADALSDGLAGQSALTRLQAEMEAIVPTEQAAPLGQGERLVPRGLPSWHSLLMELHTERPGRRLLRFLHAVIGSAILAVVHRCGGRLGSLDVNKYRHALAERSDYRKQAGGPRLVLDVTLDEADRLEALLARFEAADDILFGTARSGETTMTCLVGDFAADRHVHFVDGGGLGFWRASVVLKGKRAAR